MLELTGLEHLVLGVDGSEREKSKFFLCVKAMLFVQNVKWKNQNKILPQLASVLSVLSGIIRNYKVINGTIKIMFFVLAYLQVVTPLIASLIQGKINWAGLRVLCWVVMIYWNSCVRRILRSQSFSQWPKSLFMLFIFSFNKTKSICCTGAKPWLTVNSWFRSTWLL